MSLNLLLAVSVLIFVLSFLLLRGRKKMLNPDKDWPEAEAVILSLTLTGIKSQEKLEALIVLQVHPEWGKSFVSETTELIGMQEISTMQAGSFLKVHYQPTRKTVTIIKDSVKPRLPRRVMKIL